MSSLSWTLVEPPDDPRFGSDTLILLDFCSVFEKIFGPSGLFGCCMSNLGFQMLIPDVGYQMSDVGWHL